MNVTMQLLGTDVVRHNATQKGKKHETPALNVSGRTCVHQVALGHDCGAPVPADSPNGWLCPAHQEQLFPRKRTETGRATH